MKLNKKKLLVVGVSSVIAILLAAVIFLAWQYQKVSKGDSQDESKKTSLRVIGKVSQLYLVPAKEEPTVALIQDKSKLGNQEFFKNARNGDYLLIYQKEKVALVYREEDNKLVNVGPVNLDAETQNGQTAGAQTEESDAPEEAPDNP